MKVYHIILGTLQLVLGLAALLLNFVIYILIWTDSASHYFYHSAFLYGVGVWGGIYFIVTGAFGIDAGRRRIKCVMITYMVLSTIGVVMVALAMVIVTAVILHINQLYISTWKVFSTLEALHWVLMALAIPLFITAVISAIFGYKEVCGCAQCCGVCCDCTDDDDDRPPEYRTRDRDYRPPKYEERELPQRGKHGRWLNQNYPAQGQMASPYYIYR